MMHTMKLNTRPFERMKEGKKMVEYRLNDEKRKRLKLGDTIIFQKLSNLDEKLLMEITDLNLFNNFYDAFLEFVNVENSDIGESIEKAVNSMYEYYEKNDEKKYGCLAISLKTLN